MQDNNQTEAAPWRDFPDEIKNEPIEPQHEVVLKTLPSLSTRRKHIGIRQFLGRAILAAAILRGGVALGSELGKTVVEDAQANTPGELNTNSPQATSEIVIPGETKSRLEIRKEEIEKKFNINLYTMKEGFAVIGKEYDEQNPELVGQSPPVRWEDAQLNLLDEMLSFLPESLYEDKQGKKTGIILGDFGTDCKCGGVSFNETGVIGLPVYGLDNNNREGAMSLLVHEMTHRWDALTNYKMVNEINKIFGDKFNIDEKELVDTGDPDLDRGAARSTVMQLSKGQFTEPIANISQFYARGYDRFMNALGPLLDGSGYPDNISTESPQSTPAPVTTTTTGELKASPTPEPVQDLSVLYPKTQALYDLYKAEVFQGKEYTNLDLYNIKFSKLEQRRMEHSEDMEFKKKHSGSNRIKSELEEFQPSEDTPIVEQSAGVDDVLKKIQEEYGIKFFSEGYLTVEEANILNKIIHIFPKEVYPKNLAIVIPGENGGSGPGNSIFIGKEDLHSATGLGVQRAQVYHSIRELAWKISVVENNPINYQVEKEITNILGGEQFLESPETYYPKLKELKDFSDEMQYSLLRAFDVDNKANSSSIYSILSYYYLGGWETFSRVAEITDPQIKRNQLLNPDFDYSKTKAGKIYNEIKKVYGIEFTGKTDGHGIPEVIPVASN